MTFQFLHRPLILQFQLSFKLLSRLRGFQIKSNRREFLAIGDAMRGGSTGIGYGLKYQARCISDVKADTDNTSFLTGTLSLKEENEVHLIRLSSDGNELICEGLFSHPNEIWDLASCPFDQRIFSTVFSSGESFGAAIWQIPELYGQLNSPQLERISSLDEHDSKVKCVLWWPTGRHDKLVSIDEQNLFLWSLDTSKKTAQVQAKESSGMLHYLSGGAWDPHDANAVALTCDSSIQFWDLRTMKKTNSIDHAHAHNVDYDIKKKYMLATAADESGIHVWDLRMLNFPVLELPGHAHWTWTVKSNPEYEGLILSAGTDSAVNLWFASPPNVEDLTSESSLESPIRKVEPLLNSYSYYEDSVYGLAWSSQQPWIFASLSYDGRVRALEFYGRNLGEPSSFEVYLSYCFLKVYKGLSLKKCAPDGSAYLTFSVSYS